MKSELRVAPPSALPGQTVVEVWWNGVLVGIVYGADGPGVRVVSKYLRNSADGIVLCVDYPPALEVSLRP